MHEYQHVLLATDLSKQSDKVAKRAHEVAQKNQAKLSVVYVMEHAPVAYGGEYSIPIDINLEESLKSQAEESLAKLGKKFDIPNDQQIIATGSVKLGVIETANELNTDLIVVGTHSHHGLDALLGSRASSILNHAKCDVLVVRVNES